MMQGKKSHRFMDLFNLLFIQTQKGNLIAQCTHKYFHPIIQIQYYTVPEQTPSKLKKTLKNWGGYVHKTTVVLLYKRSADLEMYPSWQLWQMEYWVFPVCL